MTNNKIMMIGFKAKVEAMLSDLVLVVVVDSVH